MDGEQNVPQTGNENKKSNKTIIIVVVIVVIVVALLFGSRSFTSERSMERMIENATGKNVDIDMNATGQGTMMITGEDGAKVEFSAGGNATIPDTWPSDMPVIDNAEITYSGSMSPQEGQSGAVLMFTVSKSLSNVVTFYQEALNKNGWNVEGTMQAGEGTMLIGKKGDRGVSIMIGTDQNKTTVQISISTE